MRRSPASTNSGILYYLLHSLTFLLYFRVFPVYGCTMSRWTLVGNPGSRYVYLSRVVNPHNGADTSHTISWKLRKEVPQFFGIVEFRYSREFRYNYALPASATSGMLVGSGRLRRRSSTYILTTSAILPSCLKLLYSFLYMRVSCSAGCALS